ncbi:hypothetical protein [Pseudoalteromonas spongiae]|uniref:hypothetical protein n=1 Tax=Pseudoalteromonas spongiae TaxID=298657 RepID=UPI000C2CF667|nr:hypothetical protein [Pseudoalteromonas spongiae]
MSAFWNYRVIECPSDEGTLFQVHVVEYNINGKAVNWSETAEGSFGTSLTGLAEDIERQKQALEKPLLTVKRLARGYELVEVESGDVASSPVPESLQEQG